jgi:hypothetical protein
MNYRELLKKYIRNVGEWESVTFLSHQPDYITDEEWAELRKLDAEVIDEVIDEVIRP